jgi:flavin-dependent dehydrogenase
VQGTIKGEYDERFVEVHLGDFAKGFFAWVVPIDKNHAKVGLGTTLGENISENFKDFLNKRFNGEKVHVSDKISALIPYGDPLQGIVKENYALVGDAAFQTKSTTGGGIIFGMKAGNILGEVIAKTLTKQGNLRDYEKKLESINKELKLHWKIRRYANTLSNEEINDLFKKLKEKDFEKFLEEHGHMDEPSKFVGKLISNPKYWSMAGSALKFFRT